MDNKSQNGTYINGTKLGPGEKHDLQYADIVCLEPLSEMPQAFSYEERQVELMETDDDDDIIVDYIILPSGGNSESLLDEGISSYVDPTISFYPEEHWELDKRKSRNSQKSKELEVKLALLSEEIKALQESKLELLKKYEDVCEKNKVLDKQLTDKQKKLEEDLKEHDVKVKNEVKSELLKKFEEELVCNICTELFIKPVVLDCSHTFCEYCIKEWKKKKNDCPICRCKIKTTIRIRTLEEFIDKVLTTLTPEQRATRAVAQAQRLIAEQPPKPAQTPRRRRGASSRRGGYSRSNVVNANISVEIAEEIVTLSRSHNFRRVNRSNGRSSDTGVPNQEASIPPTHSHTVRMLSRPNGNSSATRNLYPDDSIRPNGVNFFPYVN